MSSKGSALESTAPDADIVRDLVERISTAWREKRYAELGQYFDERMVMTGPGINGRVQGREACVGTFEQFLEGVTITRFSQDALRIDVWGNTAVATYAWEMAWQTGGPPSEEKGHDVFVFTRAAFGSEPPWRAVWRTMTVESEG